MGLSMFGVIQDLRNGLDPYVKMSRPSHWVKNLFILPGAVAYWLISQDDLALYSLARDMFLAFAATSFVASANYMLNEWLDASFDKHHPHKQNRPAARGVVRGKIVAGLYVLLSTTGLAVGSFVSPLVAVSVFALWIMGVLYNVPPIRLKDLPYFDVLSESVNNAIRLYIGWFAVCQDYLPPISLVLGYWFGGAFLMSVKRLAELKTIGDAGSAGLYRKSFRFYTNERLLVASMLFALLSASLIGIFLIKYRAEYILLLPIIAGLFSMYFAIGFESLSVAQRPEALWRHRPLMFFVSLFLMVFLVLTVFDLPYLHDLSNNSLIPIPGILP
jgi:4-hydroxybenzoate polyprenyltransferase